MASSNPDAVPLEDTCNAPEENSNQEDTGENVSDDKPEVLAMEQLTAEPKETLHAICTDENVRQFDLEEQRQQDVVSWNSNLQFSRINFFIV